MRLFGRPACSLFALISGYFLIDAGREGHYRKIVPLIAKRSFYSLAILIVFTVANRSLPSGSIAVRSLVPTGGYNWYVYYYILFYLFLPILNPILRSLGRKSFARLLILALVAWSLLPSLGAISGALAPYWSLSYMDFFLVMYPLGAFIRLHVHGKVTYPNRRNLIAFLLSTAIVCLAVLGVDALAVLTGGDNVFKRMNCICEFNFLPSVIWAVSLFLFFLNLDFHSAAVDRIARTTVGIYIIHENDVMRSFIWKRFLTVAEWKGPLYLHALVKIPLVFVALMLVDMLCAATVGKWAMRWYVRVGYPRIDRIKPKVGRAVRRLPVVGRFLA